jgi:hypothetical protein
MIPRLGACLLAAAMLTPSLASGASPASPAPRASADEVVELGEVVVSGEKPTRRMTDLVPWIRRLLGQYRFEGFVDLGGQGRPQDLETVRGVGLCVGFGVAPGVQCEFNVRWTPSTGPNGEELLGGVSHVTPAMVLYAVEPDDLGIRYLQVDSRGLAEGSTGFVIGDTATFRAPCVDMPQGCWRVTRITAPSEGDVIEMHVDTEVNLQLAVRQRFKLTRVAAAQAPAGTSR